MNTLIPKEENVVRRDSTEEESTFVSHVDERSNKDGSTTFTQWKKNHRISKNSMAKEGYVGTAVLFSIICSKLSLMIKTTLCTMTIDDNYTKQE